MNLCKITKKPWSALPLYNDIKKVIQYFWIDISKLNIPAESRFNTKSSALTAWRLKWQSSQPGPLSPFTPGSPAGPRSPLSPTKPTPGSPFSPLSPTALWDWHTKKRSFHTNFVHILKKKNLKKKILIHSNVFLENFSTVLRLEKFSLY